MSFVFDRWFKFLLGALVFLFFLISVQDVYAPPLLPGDPNYSVSAHGSAAAGVNRNSTATIGYAKGHCAHCHEQHASIGGAEPEPKAATPAPSKFCLLADNFSGKTPGPYAQADNVCFYCHCDATATTLQSPAFSNYSYNRTFGGYTTDTTASIMDAFNLLSYHNLNDVYNYITGASGSKAWTNFPADSNPCSGCHNVHIAKRNKANPGNPSYTAISKPSIHGELWGDDVTTERMSIYAGALTYQAPYYYALTPSMYEPDNSITTDGSNLPDYVTFCTDCHNSTNAIVSAALGTLKTIDWETTGGETGGDKHGKNAATVGVNLDAPYAAVWGSNGLVLACTDCHEPHGAPNVMLIRKEVNGATLDTITTITSTDCTAPYSDYNKELGYLCNRCHKDDGDHYANATYANRWYWVHHESSDSPYSSPSSCPDCHSSGSQSGYTSTRTPINCNCCHYHGSSAAGRRTF